jgi:hypothetical protein
MAKLVQFLFAVIALAALCADAATVPTIYVSPSGTHRSFHLFSSFNSSTIPRASTYGGLLAGNDSWTGGSPTKGSAGVNGTVAGPLRTLAAAALVARSRYGAGVTKTVSVAAGTYTLSSSLALTAADSNTLFVAAVRSAPLRLMSCCGG